MRILARAIARHWRGEVSLARAFWVNFVLVWAALHFCERFFFPPFLHGETRVTFAVAAYFVCARLPVYAWQIAGVLRACEKHIAGRGERTWAAAAQGAVLLSVVATLSAAFSTYQNLLAYKNSLHAPLAPAQNYSLELSAGATLLHVRGPLHAGITARVEKILDAHPQVRALALQSGGGQIYEGRGLARVVRERGLATYAVRECASSCVTAFVAGNPRILGDGAKLGFHRYKNYAALPKVDIDAEHAADIELFRAQGVSEDFLRKMFSHPPEEMWWPREEELRAAGVVHRAARGE